MFIIPKIEAEILPKVVFALARKVHNITLQKAEILSAPPLQLLRASALKIEKAYPSETSFSSYQTTRCCNKFGQDLDSYRLENSKIYVL